MYTYVCIYIHTFMMYFLCMYMSSPHAIAASVHSRRRSWESTARNIRGVTREPTLHAQCLSFMISRLSFMNSTLPVFGLDLMTCRAVRECFIPRLSRSWFDPPKLDDANKPKSELQALSPSSFQGLRLTSAEGCRSFWAERPPSPTTSNLVVICGGAVLE